ncbi:MAG: hypothetical protein V4619_13650 [Bacteroidota bacterium]
MKPFISKTFYGILNYLMAATLLSSPWLFGFADVRGTFAAAFYMPLLMGWLHFIMSAFSESPTGFSFLKVFPMQMNNLFDVLTGTFLLSLPMIYGFCHVVFWPHFLMGLVLTIKGIFAQDSPFLTRPHRALPEGNITSTDSLEGRLDQHH